MYILTLTFVQLDLYIHARVINYKRRVCITAKNNVIIVRIRLTYNQPARIINRVMSFRCRNIKCLSLMWSNIGKTFVWYPIHLSSSYIT